MKHLHRVHGVSIASIHKIGGQGRASPFIDVIDTPIDDMKTDMSTNVFTTPCSAYYWTHMCSGGEEQPSLHPSL